MPTDKDLEKEVLAERQAEEKRQIAEEVARKQAALESKRLLQAREAEHKRAQLLRPMDRQAIFGVTVDSVTRRLPQKYPLENLPLPENVVVILEEAFAIPEDCPTLLSKVCTTIIHNLVTGEGEQRRQAQAKGVEALEEGSLGPLVDVPIWLEWVGASSLAVCGQLVIAWALEYKARRSAQEALLQAEKE